MVKEGLVKYARFSYRLCSVHAGRTVPGGIWDPRMMIFEKKGIVWSSCICSRWAMQSSRLLHIHELRMIEENELTAPYRKNEELNDKDIAEGC